MDQERRGICLLIENDQFQPNLQLSGRKGSEIDLKAANDTFTSLGFEVAKVILLKIWLKNIFANPLPILTFFDTYKLNFRPNSKLMYIRVNSKLRKTSRGSVQPMYYGMV